MNSPNPPPPLPIDIQDKQHQVAPALKGKGDALFAPEDVDRSKGGGSTEGDGVQALRAEETAVED